MDPPSGDKPRRPKQPARGRGTQRGGSRSQRHSTPLATDVEAIGQGEHVSRDVPMSKRGGRGASRRKGSHGHKGKLGDYASETRKPPPPNYFTRDDIDELSKSDDQTVVRHISQNEKGFLKAFKHEKFCTTPKVVKQLVKILYKLAQSSEPIALRILAQIFGSSGEHAFFLFHLELHMKGMVSETKQFIRVDNHQAVYHLTEIGKFCMEKIPKTVERTFPIHSIQTTTNCLLQCCTSIEQDTLEHIEQSIVELQVQFQSFQEEQAKPKPKPRKNLVDALLVPPELFSTLPILPLAEEIHYYAKKPFLRPNIVKGNYHNWDHYIDVQFRLLREDFVGPLRAGIAEHNEGQSRGGEVRVYQRVRIEQPVCLSSGIGFDISFDLSALRRVNWEYTKRLINGSLLCLSTDNFETIAFASVVNRESEKLKEGIVTVKFEGTVNGFQLNPQAVYTMVESVAYFEAYRHVLEKLQAVSQEHEVDMMPFKPYIVDCVFEDVPLPQYLNHNRSGHTIFDLQGIVEVKSKYVSTRVDLTQVATWPDADVTDLDRSQMRALQAALTQELSVIQGPPGTGKTYVGMKIVQAFLANREVWDPHKTSPILVVCYTNHALDQFLEGIHSTEVHGKAPNVTRIGGRCKSEILANCTLYEKVNKARSEKLVPKKVYADFRKARGKMIEQKDMIIKYLEVIQLSNYKILHIDRLQHVILQHHHEQLTATVYTENPIELWLGLQYAADTRSNDHPTTEQTLQYKPQVGVNEQLASEISEDSIDNDDDTEVQMLLDDRLVDGNEVIYRAQAKIEEKNPQGLGKKKKDGWQTVQMDESKRNMLIRKQLSQGLKPMSFDEACLVNDIWLLGSTQRWKLYLHWKERYINSQRQQLDDLSQGYKDACEEFQLSKQAMELTVVEGSDVVGMTTTGASKHNHIVKSILPKTMVVEEAAEIFEPHIFTSLSTSVQQLILIGDHQQLRPKPTCYELETKYNFNVSLFERLALNGCPVQTLNIQHRMRPEVASLITPAVYTELYNHESVENYSHVQGVAKSLFFVNHNILEPELTGIDDQKSHSNPHEAQFLGALCDYLLKQDYDPSKITILTLYRGQLLEIKKILRSRKITGVRTAVVDDFQGEENEIILLSLVRSNHKRRIGFVGIENRVCVALSRAKIGLYIVGNLEMLRDKLTTIWPKVIKQLSSMECIGETLPLHCPIHPDQKVNAKKAEDFLKCPEGGCKKKCDARLRCGHVCRRLCHPYDIQHLKYKCPQKCSKQLACGHVCKRKCYECSESCKPCKEKVTKVVPSCGHTQECACSDDPLLVKCSKLCEKMLQCRHHCQRKCSVPCTTQCIVQVNKHLSCGHTVQAACYLREELVKCPIACGSQLDCEHTCTGTCDSCKKGRLHSPCASQCGRQLMCGHICDFPCTPSCPPCSKVCANFCSHSRCPKKCSEPCTPCKEPCDWSCPHFKCTQLCGSLCDRPPCDQPCPEYLVCGHKCIGLCGELCPKLCRICNREEVTEILFGAEDEEDAKFVLLPDCHHIIEVGALDQWMSTTGETSESEEVTLKVCPKCKTPVRRCLRYGNDIKRKIEDVEAIKRKQVSNIQSMDLTTELARVKASLKQMSSSSSSVVVDEIAMIDIEVNALPENKGYIVFPHVTKTQLSILLQVAQVSEILSSVKHDLYPTTLKYSSRTEKTKQGLNHLKKFIMQAFLSQQQISDALAEMRRLSLLAKLTELQVKLTPKRREVSKADNDSIEKAIDKLDQSGWKREKVSAMCENEVLQLIKSVCDKYCIDRLSETERLEIVSAIGLSKGHWYKCPNGHFYCIGQCGGAVETAKCPECKANIGGVNHALEHGNLHAPEMDDSRHAAWSDAANLENLDPQELAQLQM